MTEAEKRIWIDAFLSDALDLAQVQAFNAQLARDAELRKLLAQELEIIKSLDPEGDYQRFRQSLDKVGDEFWGDGETRNHD